MAGLGALLTATSTMAAFYVNESSINDPCYKAEIPCPRQVLMPPPTQINSEYAPLPECETNRWYGRVGVNFGSLRLKNIKNASLGIDTGGVVFQKAQSLSRVAGLEFAVGYNWSKMLHGEFEYLVIRNFPYSTNPVLTNVPIRRSLNALLKNNTFLYNMYMDATLYDHIKPFLTGGIGFAFNSAKSTLTPPAIEGGGRITRTIGLAYQAGVGVRMHLFTRGFLSVSYRYIGLGQMRIRPNDNLRIKARYSMLPFSISFGYLF